VIRTLLKLAAVAAALGAASLAQAQELPPGPGRETLVAACSSCHEPQVVADKQMSKKEWEDTVHSMVDRGADATEAQVVEIVAYLVANFSGALKAPAQPAAAPPAK
jgi:mono/diheme cytochrome c family protein